MMLALSCSACIEHRAAVQADGRLREMSDKLPLLNSWQHRLTGRDPVQ
jgi:hypothetical protein